MPNSTAYFAILAWPLVAVVLFRVFPVPKAAAISIIAGYLLLPIRTAYNLPLMPAYNQEVAAALPTLLLALFYSRQPGLRPAAPPPTAAPVLEGWLPKAILPKLCVIVLLASPFVTALLNMDALSYGGKFLRPLSPYDAASSALAAAMALLPFFIARKYLAHPREHAMLLVLLCLAGLLYSLPTLYEARMSPQINRMIYGFAPDWMMSMRGGGWRPSVFLGHGLKLGIFMTMCVLAALACTRTRPSSQRWLFFAAAFWLFVTLVVCKTFGALLIAVVLAPVILLCRVRLQLLTAAVLAAIVLTYPMMRGAGLVPTETIVAGVSKIADAQRIGSLNYRFKNEDILLEKANDRPLFGWGGWGRGRIYDEQGRDISTTDGLWVIIFGEGGWIRYLSYFGLLTLPIILLALRQRQYEVTLATSALALVLTANLIDLLPNSGISPIVWLISGALVGRMEIGTAGEPEPDAAAAAPVQTSPYRRALSGPGAGRPAPSLRRKVRSEARRSSVIRRGGRG